jgi:hypothetical protein
VTKKKRGRTKKSEFFRHFALTRRDFHRLELVFPAKFSKFAIHSYFAAIASISIRTPFGSLDTSTQERAGHAPSKYFA